MGRRTGGMVAIVLVWVLPVACGADDPTALNQPPTSPPDPEEEPVVDTALAGAWTGTIEGVHDGEPERSTVRFELDLSGSMRVEPARLPFHGIPTGSWGVIENEFRASGSDTQSTMVTFRAPRSETRLQGTWTTTGSTGTFNITRQ